MRFRPEGLLPSARRRRELHATGETAAAESQQLFDLGAAHERPGDHRRPEPRPRTTARDPGGAQGHPPVRGAGRGERGRPHRRAAQIVGLIGPNGAGKTTFFNLITGLYAPTEGDVLFEGKRLGGLKPHQDHQARHRPHLPEHPAVPRHDGAARTCWSAGTAHPARSWSPRCVRGRRVPPRGAGEPRRGPARCWSSSACRQARERGGQEPALRRPAPAGDRPRTGDRAAAAVLLDEPAAGMNPQEKTGLNALIQQIRGHGPVRSCSSSTT